MTIVDVTTIVLDKKTKRLLRDYCKTHVISRSAAIRLIVNDFFLNRGGKI